jgi:hypothetical protein
MLDFLDTKKKLAGDRKPVFPEGVPGLEQGVPKELYKGSQQEQLDQQNAAAAAAQPAPPPEPPKGAKKHTKRAAPAADQAAAPDAATEEGAPAAVPPDPKPKKIVRRRLGWTRRLLYAGPSPAVYSLLPFLQRKRARCVFRSLAARLCPMEQNPSQSTTLCTESFPVFCSTGSYRPLRQSVNRKIAFRIRYLDARAILPIRLQKMCIFQRECVNAMC